MTTQHPCQNYPQFTGEDTVAQEGEVTDPRITQFVGGRVKNQTQTSQAAEPRPQGHIVGLQ